MKMKSPAKKSAKSVIGPVGNINVSKAAQVEVVDQPPSSRRMKNSQSRRQTSKKAARQSLDTPAIINRQIYASVERKPELPDPSVTESYKAEIRGQLMAEMRVYMQKEVKKEVERQVDEIKKDLNRQVHEQVKRVLRAEKVSETIVKELAKP